MSAGSSEAKIKDKLKEDGDLGTLAVKMRSTQKTLGMQKKLTIRGVFKVGWLLQGDSFKLYSLLLLPRPPSRTCPPPPPGTFVLCLLTLADAEGHCHGKELLLWKVCNPTCSPLYALAALPGTVKLTISPLSLRPLLHSLTDAEGHCHGEWQELPEDQTGLHRQPAGQQQGQRDRLHHAIPAGA